MSVFTNIGTPSAVPSRMVLGGGPRTIIVSATSILTCTNQAASVQDFLTAFDIVIPVLGLTDDSQGSHALVHALLTVAGLMATRSGPYSNPCDQVLLRLEEAGINPHALAYLRQYMNSASEAYSRRN
jgi:hypothetical protein